jgi:hypothetical protein
MICPHCKKLCQVEYYTDDFDKSITTLHRCKQSDHHFITNEEEFYSLKVTFPQGDFVIGCNYPSKDKIAWVHTCFVYDDDGDLLASWKNKQEIEVVPVEQSSEYLTKYVNLLAFF